jgi:hypothetical protein
MPEQEPLDLETAANVEEPELETCDWCNEESDSLEEWTGTYGGDHAHHEICEACFNELICCDECGEAVEDESVWSPADTSLHYCYSCADDISAICNHCDERVHHDDFRMTEDEESSCDSCFEDRMSSDGIICSECGSPYWYQSDSNGRWVTDTDSWVCNSCLRNICAHECSECDEMRTDVMFYENRYGDRYRFCVECAEDNELNPDDGWEIGDNPQRQSSRLWGSGLQVHNYTYKPSFDFKMTAQESRLIGRRPRTLFMGTELEMQVVGTEAGGREANYTKARQFLHERDTHRLVYLKEDSSIGYGFELVTHPFTWAWSQENLEVFDMIFELGKWCEAYRNNQCGMHVHMGRSAFSQFHLYKFARFFYDNPDFIYRVSRRTKREQFVEYSNPKPYKNLMALARSKTYGNRRGMLNFEGGDTVECRIFNGTISRGGFFGNLEFLKALYDYTKQAPLHHLVPDGFMEFVESDHYRYFNTLGKAGSWPTPAEE